MIVLIINISIPKSEIRKLEKAYRRYIKRFDNVKQPLKNAAEIYAANARKNAPVRTGELRNSIDVHELDGKSAMVGPSDDQSPKAQAQEFGTRFHSPQPYMRPAEKQSKAKAQNKLFLDLKKIARR